jgi:TolA-binding protein
MQNRLILRVAIATLIAGCAATPTHCVTEPLDAAIAAAARPACRKQAESAIAKTAFTLHKAAFAAKSGYEAAEPAYQAYLRLFPDGAERGKAAFYYGELLYSLGRFCDAARTYTMGDHRVARDRVEAAFGAVSAWDKCLPKIGESADGALTADEATFLRAIDVYLAESPPQKEAVLVRYRRARLLYKAARFDEAATEFSSLVDEPDAAADPLRGYSAQIALDSWVQAKRYALLVESVERWHETEWAKRDPELRWSLHQADVGARRKLIEDAEKAGDDKGAAVAYLALADRTRGDLRRDELLYNSFILARRAHDDTTAATALQRLVADHPQSPLTARAKAMK